MKNNPFIALITGILLLITSPILLASNSFHKANRINLSNNAIICMHQDADGYLWIGTYDGLNLYNGKNTYVYRFQLNNKNSLCSNIIHKITDAEPGFLWIATSLGINKFSLYERKVTESFPGYMECTLLATDPSGVTLAICKEDRISCYIPSGKEFRDLSRKGIGPQTARALFTGDDGHFYLLLASGNLKKLTPDFSASAFDLRSEERPFHNKPIVYASYENRRILFVDSDNKLYRQPVAEGNEKEFLADLSGMTRKHGNITGICTFQSTIYVVFRNGHILDLSQPEKTIDTGIGIFCLMNDKRQEILWIGTDGQGIQMFYDKPDLFGSILLKDLPVNIQNPIRSLYTDADGSLWFSTNKGLTKYNPSNNFYHNYRQPYFDVTEFSDDAYWKCFDSGRLFFGGIDGLVWINKQPALNFFEVQMDKQLIPLNKHVGRDGVTVPADVQSLTIAPTEKITSMRINCSTIILRGKNCKKTIWSPSRTSLPETTC